MNELHEAYKILELPPGSDMAAVKRKYRLLSTVWHPDRMASEDFRKQAEDKLKTINNARDVLKKHFETDHRDSHCDCQEQDPEVYRKKEQEAKERFHREQEERRRATQAEERQTRARDEARRKKREREEEERRSNAEKADWQQASSEQVDAATEQANRLEAHESLLKYTRMSVCAFIATGVILSINLGLANWRADSLKDYKPWEYDQYYELSDKLSKDKSDYLEKHINKKLRSYANEFHPPYDETFRKLQQRFFYPPKPRPKPRPIEKEPVLTQQDRNDIGSLEGHYSTRTSLLATNEKLKYMSEDLKTALSRTNNNSVYNYLKPTYDRAEYLYKANKRRLDQLDEHIRTKENRIKSRLGTKYLPKKPSGKGKPYVIDMEAAYHNAKNNYPNLFR